MRWWIAPTRCFCCKLNNWLGGACRHLSIFKQAFPSAEVQAPTGLLENGDLELLSWLSTSFNLKSGTVGAGGGGRICMWGWPQGPQGPRYLVAETGERGCQGATSELMTFWLWQCIRVRVVGGGGGSNTWSMCYSTFKHNRECSAFFKDVLQKWTDSMAPSAPSIFVHSLPVFETWGFSFHHIILQASEDLRH